MTFWDLTAALVAARAIEGLWMVVMRVVFYRSPKKQLEDALRELQA